MMKISYPSNAILCFTSLVDVANMNILPKPVVKSIVEKISFWKSDSDEVSDGKVN